MIIAATGHRPDKLGGYSALTDSRLRLVAHVHLRRRRPDGVISGMALGWDMAVAEAALYFGIPLIAVLPFATQDQRWPDESPVRWRSILRRAAQVVTVCQGGYAPSKMQRRNEWMADKSNEMMALWDGSSGGTANCLAYAEQIGRPVVNLAALVDARMIATAPEWLTRLAGRPHERPERSETPAVEPDLPGAIARATEYLRDRAEIAVQGSGGNDTSYRVACRLRDMGVSEPMALELMLDHWNERCSPPWPADELAEGPVKSAYRYAQNALGQRAPEAQFSPIETGFEALDPENVSRREGLFYVEGVDVRPELKQLALIKGLFDQAAMSVVFGASNSGKTFFMMSVSYHVVTGTPFDGRRTAQGNVVYVATEAGRSAERRVEALKRHFRWDGRGFFLIPCRVDLRRPNADTAALITLIREIEEKHGKVLMIVIDTLARALAGGDENSSQDMGAVIGNVDRIRTALRAHTAIVHHSGKDQARG